MMRDKVKVFKNILIMSASSTASLLLGLVKNSIVASRFGTSRLFDAYVMAMTLAEAVFYLASKGFVSFVPIFTNALKENEETAWETGNRLISAWVVLLSCATVLAVIFFPYLLPVVAPGFDLETIELTSKILGIVLWGWLFLGLGTMITQLAYVYHLFSIPSISSITNNIVIIICLLLFVKMGILGLAWAVLIGAFIQVLIQSLFLRKLLFHFKFILDFKNPSVRQAITLSIPLYLAHSGVLLDKFISQAFASTLSEGTVSAFAYGRMLSDIPMSIFGLSIGQVFYPIFSEYANDHDPLIKNFSGALKRATLLIPMTVGIFILSMPIVRILLGRGTFTPESTALTSVALSWLVLGLPAEGWNFMYATVFMAKQDTKTPLIVGLVKLLAIVVLSFFLIGPFGIVGLAVATSLSGYVKVLLYSYMLHKKSIFLPWKDIGLFSLKVTIASLVMGGVVYGIEQSLGNASVSVIRQLFTLSVSVGFGVVVFGLFVWLLKLDMKEWT